MSGEWNCLESSETGRHQKLKTLTQQQLSLPKTVKMLQMKSRSDTKTATNGYPTHPFLPLSPPSPSLSSLSLSLLPLLLSPSLSSLSLSHRPDGLGNNHWPNIADLPILYLPGRCSATPLLQGESSLRSRVAAGKTTGSNKIKCSHTPPPPTQQVLLKDGRI